MRRTIEIERVDRGNVGDLITLIGELARYEHAAPPDGMARRRLRKDALAEDPPFRGFVAYVDGEPKGYALYYPTYSTFDGKPIFFLEDIFVLESERRTGLGKKLFDLCLEEAERQGCGCMEWAVLKWNKDAIGFYERMGGKRRDAHLYEIDEKDF